MDETRARWRRRPVLAFAVRAVVVLAPLAASVVVGIVASRAFRPHDVVTLALWVLWTASVSLLVLWAVDVVVRRLLPLQRLLQLCLAFPDRAPSRMRVAVRAARNRRPEALLDRSDVPTDAAAVAEQIVTLLAALALHDRRTRGHSERVCAYTNLLAEQMHLSPDDADRLTWVALVHDIGKLHVPARLLNKPGRPTVTEWALLQTHPERGAAITEPLRDWLGPWADAVLEHHERYDGAGYPRGLAGERISLAARIVAVTDAFEVMTAPRAYRRPVDAQSARAELARHAESQFDPEVVRQFLAIGLPKLRRAMGPIAWLAEIPFVSSWPRLEAAASSTLSQAATATAAASTAGLLAVGGAGPSVAAAAPATSGGALPRDLPVNAEPVSHSPTARPAQPTAAAASHDKQRAVRTRRHVHTSGDRAATHADAPSPAAPARATAVASRSAAAASSTRTTPARQHHTQATRSGQAPTPEPTPTCSDGDNGRAVGHEHAPGWQKNWGPNGRHPGHAHPHDGDSCD